MKQISKKILCVIMIGLIVMTLFTGCGNMSLSTGNYNFEKVHIDTYHYSGCVEVKKWYDTSTGLEIKTEDYGNIFLSEGSCYVMVEDKCPICDEAE